MERKLEQGGVEINHAATKSVYIVRDGLLLTIKDSWTGTGVTATAIFKLLVIGLLAFDFVMTTQIIRYMPRNTADYEQECSPKVLNPSRIEYHSNHDFYSALRAADLQSPPTFHGEHTKLCDEQGGMRDQYSYCLPISGRKDTPFCTNADRMNLLNVHSSKPICYASVLHMLLLDVYDELQATGNIPFLAFGSLLGAVRNQSMIPFTEDADIGYVGELITLEKLILALRRKGYHMFFMDIWRVCVAPTHPLVSHLYDANLPITKNYSVPYLDLYEIKKTDFGDWDLQELPGLLPDDKVWPFSSVTINGMVFMTVRDPTFFLMKAYGEDYMIPKPRTEED